MVAPCVGAWIETTCSRLNPAHLPASLPAWERGLKRLKYFLIGAILQSLPAWERGLKQKSCLMRILAGNVAPCVGAWIETLILVLFLCIRLVAPCVGAWIETHSSLPPSSSPESLPAWERGLKPLSNLLTSSQCTVAPCVGAWIETNDKICTPLKCTTSLPAWERGLKPSGTVN